MKAEDLKLEELISFENGKIELHGRRLVLHSIHAMAQFRRDLVQTVGMEQTHRILTRFGYFWGTADAAAMTRIFEWDNRTEWLKAGPRMHSLQGVARAEISSLTMDETTGHFETKVVWRNSGEAEEHLIEFGRADKPICWMLVGYASGYASYCFGKPIFFVEEKCRAAGDRVCAAIGKDEKSWGTELRSFRSFFQEDDIQGKVARLSRELRRKTREVAHQRQRLRQLGASVQTNMVEVRSAAFRRVLDIADRIAPYDSSVLIVGESGVGKEVLARHIHSLSTRSSEPFVTINCGALPETLLESELFGHKQGAFTGASADRIGLFEEAHRGTLFLDEIGDVSAAVQVKLLRALQEKEVTRVGENIPRKTDVRVIAATNQDIVQAIEKGQFREDLYYRLAVIEIEIPPLRERPEDILPLARHFTARLRKKLNLEKLRLDASCLDYLRAYSWPGNVRELENAIERGAVLSPDGCIRPEGLPPGIIRAEHAQAGSWQAGKRTLADVERAHIKHILTLTDGNRSRAARILGISPTTLWRKLKHANHET